MIVPAGPNPDTSTAGGEDAAFSSLLEEGAEDLYENAPCGYLSTLLDGQIAKVNATLLEWLGYERGQLVGRRHFADLLTVGGRMYHETHFAPLLRMHGQVSGIALELKTRDGARLPVLVSSTVKTSADGQPLLIRTTVFDARERRAYEMELLRARREAEEAHQRAEQERARLQRLTATFQRTLLPPRISAPPGLEVAAYYHTASPDRVGGDFYDFYALPDGRWSLFLGDVCGKGAMAAAVTSLARYTLRAAAMHDPDPAAALRDLNTAIAAENRGLDMRFCTAIAGLLTPGRDGCTVELATGGHPPPLLLRADGHAAYQETPGGQLLGVIPAPHIATTTLRLAPGDSLLLYTDGLTEARDTSASVRERYGEQALLAFAAKLAPARPAQLINALTGLLDSFGPGLEDDTALLALGMPAGTPRSPG